MGISSQQALECFQSDDLIGIGMEADAVRRRLHPEGVVSYSLDGVIDCSGVSVADIHARVYEILEMGGSGVTLLDGLPQGDTLAERVNVLAGIKREFPDVWLQGASATTILSLAQTSGLSVREILLRLQAAGLASMPGGDAGILSDDRRTRDWLEVHRIAHSLGLVTLAGMTFGAGETAEQRVGHLERVHELQAETGGFAAFIPQAFQPHGTALRDEATAVEYLTALAISRVYLDNIENIEADWATQGLKVLQMGLRFGGNDAGSLFSAGRSVASEEEVRQIIRDAGFRPVQRDAAYRTMFLS